jgi:WD40 repeat protein
MNRFCDLLILVAGLAMLAGCASTQPYKSSSSATSIAFSPDQRLLAYANATHIHLVDIKSRKRVSSFRALPQNPDAVDPGVFRHGTGDSMVFLDNTRIASTGMGGLVSIWDGQTGRRLAVIGQATEEEYASTIDFSAPTNRLAIGTSTGDILLTTLNGNDGGPLVKISESIGYVWDLQFSRDGNYLASASLVPGDSADHPDGAESEDRPDDPWTYMQVDETSDEATYKFVSDHAALPNVFIWDLENRQKAGALEGARHVRKMELVPGGRALLTAGENVAVWEFLTREQAEEISDPSMVMQAIGVGTMVAVSLVGMAGAVAGMPIMSTGDAVLLGASAIPMPTSIRQMCAREVAISPDGGTIVSTTWGPSHNVMAVIDRSENKVTEKWTADYAVCDLQFSPDGKYLLAATSRGVSVVDVKNWKRQNLKKFLIQ